MTYRLSRLDHTRWAIDVYDGPRLIYVTARKTLAAALDFIDNFDVTDRDPVTGAFTR